MKLRLTIVLLTGSLLLNAQENPYGRLSYDSLVIYDFDYQLPRGGRVISIIDQNGQLPSTVRASSRLSATDAKDLTEKIGLESSYGQVVGACFDPHLGIVYYNGGMPAAYITVCLTCNNSRSSLEIPATRQGPETFEGEVFYTLYGFSKSFRKYLNDMKKNHGFRALEALDDPLFDH